MRKFLTLFVIPIILLTSCTNSNLEGKYINTKGGLYSTIEFKGKTSCVVTDGIIGMPFATSYAKDGNIIRIKTDKSDLMFTIKDSETLIGEGFAKGVYKKTSSFKAKNKDVIGYYKTRIDQGKEKMSTINIIRNKLLARIFAVINRKSPYVDFMKYVA